MQRTELQNRALRFSVHYDEQVGKVAEQGEFLAVHEQSPERPWHQHGGHAAVHPVGAQQGNDSEHGDKQLVAPPQIQHVIGKPKQQSEADAQQRGVVLRQLREEWEGWASGEVTQWDATRPVDGHRAGCAQR